MPFTPRQAVDEESLQREVEWVVGAGVDAFGLGLASEMPRLTRAERTRVITLVVEQARRRVPLVVAASGESASFACELGREAERSGAAALMVRPPTFEATSARGPWSFFDELLRATTQPVFLQDLPTAQLDPSLAATLEQDHPGRVALKAESQPTTEAIALARAATKGELPVDRSPSPAKSI